MGKGLRLILATAAVGLAAAPPALATGYKDFNLRRDACGTGANTRLSIEYGGATDGCGTYAGVIGTSTVYPAKDGLPVIVDGTRPVVIDIVISSFTGPPLGGLGDQQVDVQLMGRTATNPRVVMAQGSDTTAAADILRAGEITYEFSLPVKAGTYTGVTLNLDVSGSQFHGFVEDNGPSAVSLPV
jgi:hypothetical protein